MSTALIKDLLTGLQQNVQQLDLLSQLLDKQYELMGSRQSEALEQLNSQALALMEDLSACQSKREQMLSKLGLSNDRDGLQHLVSRLPAPLQRGTRQLLQELTLKTRLCQAKNEKSGHLLASQRQLTQKLLGLPGRNSYPAMQPSNI